MNKVTAGEVAGTALWIASAVQVVGYTWSAMSGEYSKFPGMGGAQTAPPPASVQQSDTNLGVPNLPRNKKFPLAVAGVAASPPQVGKLTGLQGWVNNAGKTIGNFVKSLLP